MAEGSVYQRADNGLWVVEYQDAQGRRRYRYRDMAGRKLDSKTRARQTLRQILGRRDRGASGHDPTLDEWSSWWLDELDLRPTTVADYRYKIGLLPGWLTRKRLSEVTPMDVHEACNELLAQTTVHGRPRSPSTVGQVRTVLGNCLHAARRYGHVTDNAARLARPIPHQTAEIVPLDPAAAAALLETTAGHPLGRLYALALGTGLRQGELLGLRWPHVNLRDGTVKVVSQITRTNAHKLVEGAPKSARSRRSLLLPRFCVDALKVQRAEQAMLTDVVALDGLVFATWAGTPYSPSNVRRHLTAACLQAGIPRVTFHTLRHSAATFLLDRGVPDTVIQDVLGHSDPRMLRRYAHVTDSLRRQAADAFEDTFPVRAPVNE